MKPKIQKTIWILTALFCSACFNGLNAQPKIASDENDVSVNAQEQQPREWVSKSGNFKITATLVECDEHSATLQKSDESTIVVPLNKLCQADQVYLQAFREQQALKSAAPDTDEDFSENKATDGESAMVPFETTTVPELLPLEEFEGINYEKSVNWAKWPDAETFKKDSPNAEVLEQDPMLSPAADRIKEAGMLVEQQGMHATVDAILPAGGPHKLLMLGLSGLSFQKQYDLGAVFWLGLEEQKVLGKIYLPSHEEVIDYAPAFGRLLTVADRREEGLRMGKGGSVSLTLWDLPAGGEQATALGRWRTMIGSQSKEKQQARILSEDHVIFSTDRQQEVKYSVVSVAAKKVVYDFVLNPVFKFNHKVLFSPGRRYLFVPVPQGVIVKDSRSGETIAGLRCDSPVAVACTTDGKRIAAITPKLLHIWEIGKKLIDAEGAGLQFAHHQSSMGGSANLDWVNNNLIFMGTKKTRVLIDVERERPIWEYKMDEVRTGYGYRHDPLDHIANGYLIYPIDMSEATAVGCVKLPGAGVVESAKDFAPASELIMKRGTEVRLKIDSEQHQDQIRETIEKKIRDNGWAISDAAKIEVVATLKTGTRVTHSFTFADKNQKSGHSRKDVTYSRVSYAIRIGTTWRRRGWDIDTQQSIWSGYLDSSLLHMASDLKSPENAKKLLETVNPNVFEEISIPAEIVDPRTQQGTGWTIVNRNGLDKQE